MRLTILARVAVALSVTVLSACATTPNPVFQNMREAVKQVLGAEAASLNPAFRYLRVDVEGHVIYVALGNEDRDSHGPVEVWYSAERAVLRLQDGRLVGAVGWPAEWRNVLLPESLPSWRTVANSGKPVRWTRVRDVMPGYRVGVRDALVLRAVSVPNRSELRNVDPYSLAWFEEQIEHEQGSDGNALPAARYAVDFRDGKEHVIYGEQCLASDLCLTWQRWPIAAQAADKR